MRYYVWYRHLSQKKKLLNAVLNNPRDVRFEDACKIARLLGFTGESGAGSHHAFARPGESTQLNFQSREGKIPTYQGKQLVAMIEKYRDDDDEN